MKFYLELARDFDIQAVEIPFEKKVDRPSLSTLEESTKLIDFVKTKRPRVITLETDAKKMDYQRFFYIASQILNGIRRHIFFPRKSFMCKDCEFKEPCRAWKGK